MILNNLIGDLSQNLRECLGEVLQKTNEIPTDGKQTSGNGKATNGNVYAA